MNLEPRRVLVLYTGGTIGMVPSSRGYRPEAGFLRQRLEEMSQFHVTGQPLLTLPPTHLGRTVRYEVLEFDPILDSACMGMDDWVRIAEHIAEHEADYDAFVVLHGTDTMAYTASALSFMLVNLRKTVILTGSQIPLARHRNDAADNLLGALTLAGHYDIPEVGLYFRNQLLRGNRARKVDAASFDAFDSGNLRPLARVGIGIDIAWDLVRPPEDGTFKMRPITNEHIAAVRLFPGMSADTLERILQPPLEGIVLETYGTGNAPADNPDFLRVLREASERGVVIVNVTQCIRGGVTRDYEMGRALTEVGVVSGGDMTPEAALTKLAYLCSTDLSVSEVRDAVAVSLRGEITPEQEEARYSFKEQTFVRTVARELAAETHEIASALYPVLMCAAARNNDREALVRMISAGADPSTADHDARTALHLAAAEGHEDLVRWLLSLGADADALDRWGHRPVDEARREGHTTLETLLDAYSSGAQHDL